MRTILGYTETGATIWSDNIPARAVIVSRGGLTLGQALTAAQVRPVGAGTPDGVPQTAGWVAKPLRGEAMLRRGKP